MTARTCLSTVAFMVFASLVGCGRSASVGDVLLQATVEGVVEELDYTITAADLPEIQGHRTLAPPSSSFSTLITHVPIGEGYDATVAATSADRKTTCQGAAKFDVKPNATTIVRVALTCTIVGDGQVHVVVSVECPQFRVTSFMVSPLMASVGRTIAVSATAGDADGGPITFSWSAPAGAFADASSMQTSYTCTAPGAMPLTVTAQWGPCQSSKMVTVSCLDVDGGGDAD
jgi:hypothetical protein